MAVKIVRQPNHIALIGAPTSAGAHAAGQERAPAALRAAGLVERLRSAGYEVADLGDIPVQTYLADEESPRARNIGPVVSALEALRPLVEQAYKSGALPLILGGDCTIALATLAGVRRYLHSVSLLYFDRDADFNTPATTPSGCLDGMGVAHIVGRGAPELVRFWSEPPLVREPDVVLFGLERLDPGERQLLERSPVRRYAAAEIQRRGAAAAAQAALESLHLAVGGFVLHFDVDAISSDDFSATDLPGAGGLRLEDVRQALEVFLRQKSLAALEITEYNPERDPENQGAKLLIDLISSLLAARLATLTALPAVEAPPAEATPAASAEPTVPAGEPTPPSGSSEAASAPGSPSQEEPTTSEPSSQAGAATPSNKSAE